MPGISRLHPVSARCEGSASNGRLRGWIQSQRTAKVPIGDTSAYSSSPVARADMSQRSGSRTSRTPRRRHGRELTNGARASWA